MISRHSAGARISLCSALAYERPAFQSDRRRNSNQPSPSHQVNRVILVVGRLLPVFPWKRTSSGRPPLNAAKAEAFEVDPKWNGTGPHDWSGRAEVLSRSSH